MERASNLLAELNPIYKQMQNAHGEADCIKQAYADAEDPDGYPGKIFNRWFSDVLGKKVTVPWEEFILTTY